MADKEITCQQCQGSMEKTVIARENTAVVILAVIVALVGVFLLFMFPIGTIFGALLLYAAPKIADRSTKVWKCRDCGYFFERD